MENIEQDHALALLVHGVSASVYIVLRSEEHPNDDIGLLIALDVNLVRVRLVVQTELGGFEFLFTPFVPVREIQSVRKFPVVSLEISV